MAAIRLIPKTDDGEFPRHAARELIEALPGAALFAPDFAAMIAAGRRMGWPAAMIRANEELASRGNCISFEWAGPPKISGTLYENNVFFGVVDDYWATLRFIEHWAERLGVRVHELDPPPRDKRRS
jgi:hypothetical protein